MQVKVRDDRMTVLLSCVFLIQRLAISEPNQSRGSRYHLVPFLSLVRGSPVAVAGPHTGIKDCGS